MEQQVLTRLNEIGDDVAGISKQVGEIKNNGDLLKQNLLGGVDEEMPHGRVPFLETTVASLTSRVVSLENALIRYRAFGAVIGVISGVVSGLVTGIVTGACMLLLKHALSGGR